MKYFKTFEEAFSWLKSSGNYEKFLNSPQFSLDGWSMWAYAESLKQGETNER